MLTKKFLIIIILFFLMIILSAMDKSNPKHTLLNKNSGTVEYRN
jgi:hypothetical protein